MYGRRLIIKYLNQYSIVAEIIGGSKAASAVILSRITLSPSLEEIPFHVETTIPC